MNESKPEIELKECDTPRADAIMRAINATLKPYTQHMTTATAMLLINQFRAISKLEKELIALTRHTPDVEELLKDKASLDWLTKHGDCFLFQDYETGQWGIKEYRGNINDRELITLVEEEYDTLRQAIDAAMTKK